MERIPSSPPHIPSIPFSEDRPLWSVMIPVYNCAIYLIDALESVLMQDPGERYMQIEVVDDASTDDDVEAIVKRVGKGRVLYYRQTENVGQHRNFETCIKRSQGKLVHLLHGDDRVLPGFYKKMEDLLQKHPEAGAAFCRFRTIDETGKTKSERFPEANEDGILTNWLTRIAEGQRLQFVAKVVRREVYEKLGSFYGMCYVEDWEMWVRIARYYAVAYTPELLAEYRGHLASISWRKAVSGQNTQDVLHAIKLIQEHLPEKDRKRALIRSKKHFAFINIGMANRIWTLSHDRVLAQIQIKHALSLSKDPILCYHIIKLYTKFALRIY